MHHTNIPWKFLGECNENGSGYNKAILKNKENKKKIISFSRVSQVKTLIDQSVNHSIEQTNNLTNKQTNMRTSLPQPPTTHFVDYIGSNVV